MLFALPFFAFTFVTVSSPVSLTTRTRLRESRLRGASVQQARVIFIQPVLAVVQDAEDSMDGTGEDETAGQEQIYAGIGAAAAREQDGERGPVDGDEDSEEESKSVTHLEGLLICRCFLDSVLI